ncbi:GNAT family N-acetyltransferase [Halostella pelagica]|uniref:GNAT family N-acetyltransferase n=1 Tax=Halostella pelagica TaxID=2583824 RepID=UPI0013868224|nr:GNAT family N-acetyltransferase [Halostella pelagica]
MGTEPRDSVYFEDIEEGSTQYCGSVQLSRTDIVEFASEYDPLPIHTAPEAAAESYFDGIIASGHHTLSVTVRKLVEEVRRPRAVIAGLGLDNVRWHQPVRPGDTVSVETTVVDTEPSDSNPEAGVLREEITVTNQCHEMVLSLDCTQLIERRTSEQHDPQVSCNGWDNTDCEGTPYCPPRCPRFEDEEGRQLLVRPYRSDDRQALLKLYDSVDEHDPEVNLPVSAVTRTETWIDRTTTEGWNLVVLDGDQVIGHAAVTPANSADPNVLIFVGREDRDCGIGSELIRQVIAHADDTNHRTLRANLSELNERAVTICRDNGFDLVENRLSELRMALDLQEPIVEQLQEPPAARN